MCIFDEIDRNEKPLTKAYLLSDGYTVKHMGDVEILHRSYVIHVKGYEGDHWKPIFEVCDVDTLSATEYVNCPFVVTIHHTEIGDGSILLRVIVRYPSAESDRTLGHAKQATAMTRLPQGCTLETWDNVKMSSYKEVMKHIDGEWKDLYQKLYKMDRYEEYCDRILEAIML